MNTYALLKTNFACLYVLYLAKAVLYINFSKVKFKNLFVVKINLKLNKIVVN